MNKTALSLLLCDALGKLKRRTRVAATHSLRTMALSQRVLQVTLESWWNCVTKRNVTAVLWSQSSWEKVTKSCCPEKGQVLKKVRFSGLICKAKVPVFTTA